MTGYVYAIENADGLVKLGWSTKPLARLSKINTDTTSKCRMVGFLPGTRAQEAELHALCAPDRVHGEWYLRGHMVCAFLAMIPKWERKPPSVSLSDCAPGTRALDMIKRSRGMRMSLNRALGLSSGAVYQWREVPPTRVLEVERITGIHRSELRPDLYPSETIEAAQ